MNLTSRIRILIFDDHPVIREGLKAFIATQSDMLLPEKRKMGAPRWKSSVSTDRMWF